MRLSHVITASILAASALSSQQSMADNAPAAPLVNVPATPLVQPRLRQCESILIPQHAQPRYSFQNFATSRECMEHTLASANQLCVQNKLRRFKLDDIMFRYDHSAPRSLARFQQKTPESCVIHAPAQMCEVILTSIKNGQRAGEPTHTVQNLHSAQSCRVYARSFATKSWCGKMKYGQPSAESTIQVKFGSGPAQKEILNTTCSGINSAAR